MHQRALTEELVGRCHDGVCDEVHFIDHHMPFLRLLILLSPSKAVCPTPDFFLDGEEVCDQFACGLSDKDCGRPC